MTRIHTRPAGFSILELMIGVAVLGILVAVGAPSFTKMVRTQRIASQTNAVVRALNYARIESATRSAPVALCAASSAARIDCGDTTDYEFGWLIFVDRLNPGVLDEGDEVLQTGEPAVGGFEVTGSSKYFRFGIRSGDFVVGTFLIEPTEPSLCASTGTREISVEGMGRISSDKGICS